MIKRVDQGMAHDAARLLPDVPPEQAGELRTRLRHLPVLLHTSGLAATYAFLAARSASDGPDPLRNAYRDTTRLIRERLADRGLVTVTLKEAEPPQAHRDMLEALGAMDTAAYTRAAAEIRHLVSWLSRLAQAVYAAPATNAGTGEGS